MIFDDFYTKSVSGQNLTSSCAYIHLNWYVGSPWVKQDPYWFEVTRSLALWVKVIVTRNVFFRNKVVSPWAKDDHCCFFRWLCQRSRSLWFCAVTHERLCLQSQKNWYVLSPWAKDNPDCVRSLGRRSRSLWDWMFFLITRARSDNNSKTVVKIIIKMVDEKPVDQG